MRDPSEISKEEKDHIRKSVHAEAEKIKWHTLNNKQKSFYYDQWPEKFDISRAYLKDRIMKGFEVNQGIPLNLRIFLKYFFDLSLRLTREFH